eukprot:3652900-Pyramimonas_sp.AAC.1
MELTAVTRRLTISEHSGPMASALHAKCMSEWPFTFPGPGGGLDLELRARRAPLGRLARHFAIASGAAACLAEAGGGADLRARA